jgi:D-glycero-D-manno-heptose 1,7-bisphosphate phosphatase
VRTPAAPPAPAVFLDRDGVIIENRAGYVTSWADVEFLPTAFEALRRLSRSAHSIVLVTNQSAVGRGLLALEEAVALHRRVIAEIVAHGGRVDAWYLCPHRPEQRCACRKPAPGMLQCAARDLALDLAQSYLVGDAVSDVEAAHAAGVRGILVLTGRGRHQAALLARENTAACPVVPDLAAALEYIAQANTRRGDEHSGHGSGRVHRQRGHRAADQARA